MAFRRHALPKLFAISTLFVLWNCSGMSPGHSGPVGPVGGANPPTNIVNQNQAAPLQTTGVPGSSFDPPAMPDVFFELSFAANDLSPQKNGTLVQANLKRTEAKSPDFDGLSLLLIDRRSQKFRTLALKGEEAGAEDAAVPFLIPAPSVSFEDVAGGSDFSFFVVTATANIDFTAASEDWVACATPACSESNYYLVRMPKVVAEEKASGGTPAGAGGGGSTAPGGKPPVPLGPPPTGMKMPGK